MSADRGPNPISVAWAIHRAKQVSPPRPAGRETADHEPLGVALDTLRREGIAVLPRLRSGITSYRDSLQTVDPDTLSRDEALAFWLNLYNAGALDLAGRAAASGQKSVLRVPGAFTRPWATINSEALSLAEIEHGKIRRFSDPRIHGALVCGSASCPSLRFEPYLAAKLDDQLGDQLRHFLEAGGAAIDRSKDALFLSRIFLWYGGDFTRPEKMPTWLPPSKPKLALALARWLDDALRTWVEENKPRVMFREYNWELACSVA